MLSCDNVTFHRFLDYFIINNNKILDFRDIVPKEGGGEVLDKYNLALILLFRFGITLYALKCSQKI